MSDLADTKLQDKRFQSITDAQLSKNIARYSLLLQKLTTLSQVKKLRTVIESEHRHTVSILDDFIQENQVTSNRQLRELELRRTDLTTTLSNFQSTLSKIKTSSQNAKSIHSDINTTVKEYKCLNKTLDFLNSIRILKNNITLIDSALRQGDYLLAANAFNDIRKLPSGVISSQFAKSVVPSTELPLEPTEYLTKWGQELTELFKRRFEEALETNNVDQLTTYFKLFPMIGESKLGLDLYSKYVCDIISYENKLVTESAIKYTAGFDVVLLQLFKISSTVINEHSKVIEACYGREYLTTVIEKVERETELQATLVLNFFSEKKNLSAIIKQISQYNSRLAKLGATKSDGNRERTNSNNSNNLEVDMISISDLDTLINEFSRLLQNWSMYSKFFAVKWIEFSRPSDSSDSELQQLGNPLTLPAPIAEGNFISKLEKENYRTQFETLLMNFLYRSFAGSISYEELPNLNEYITIQPVKHVDRASWPISSVLEDLTVLIRKCLIYTVNAGQYSIFSKFLDRLVVFIQNEYLVRFVQAKLASLQPKLVSLALLTASNNPNQPFSILRHFTPREEQVESNNKTPLGRNTSEPSQRGSKGISQLGKFDFRNAFANIQSNLQSVVSDEITDEETILSLHHYIVYINTLSFTTVYLEKLLITEISKENSKLLADNFPFNDDSGRLKAAINDSFETITSQITKLQNWGIKLLFDKALINKIRYLLRNVFVNNLGSSTVTDSSAGATKAYICNLEDLEDSSSLNEFVQKWKTLMVPIQNSMYDEAYNKLLKRIVNFSSHLIEQKIWSLRVNELGAIKLDRELSLFINTICGVNYTLRESFIRCTQITLLLGFDDDDFDVATGDIKEEVRNTVDWVLSPQERVQARELRVDKRH